MARKDHKNDKRRVTLPERMRMIGKELLAAQYDLSASVFMQGESDDIRATRGYRIIFRQIQAHVRAEQARNRK